MATENERYTKVASVLHWAIAALVLLGLGLAIYGSDLENDFGRSLINLHKLVGLTVLLLTVVRIVWRLTHRPPPLSVKLPRWQLLLARGVHTLFYVLLLALPLSGWLLTSAFPGRHPITIGEIAQVPYLPVVPDMAVAQTAFTIHEIGGWSMICLIALHLAGIIKHHFVDGNAILERMNPLKAR